MKIVKADNLICPIDGEKLSLCEKQLVCSNGHSFDLARQGYVNLLPVQHKRSKQPGDSKEMVVARKNFLNLGIYQPIADKLSEIALSSIDNNNASFLDAGCGEGYYLDYVFNFLKSKKGYSELTFIGLDISKYAIIEAAKKNKNITWVVGTNRKPPITTLSVDVILCVFGFQNFEGFSRVLKSNGKIILIEAGKDHLKELREIIYSDVIKSEPPVLSEATKKGFSLVDTQTLQFKSGKIDNEKINNLLLMTPHFFRATKEGQEAAVKLQKIDLTIDVVIRVLQKV